jgi:hypothetical protein
MAHGVEQGTYQSMIPEGGDAHVPEVPRTVSEKLTDDDQILLHAMLKEGLQQLDKVKYGIEAESIYGAALLLPQCARTLGWPEEMTLRAVRMYAYLLTNIVIVTLLINYLSLEELVMDGFAGQMYLCDFGAGMDAIKEGPGGRGPSGTAITPSRMYTFSQWSTRNFVKDSLKMILPDMAHKIEEHVDPGEYGVESQACRYLAVFVFMVSLVQEIEHIRELALLLWYVPNENEDWIAFEECRSAEVESRWLKNLNVKVAGMSPKWKIWNAFVILLPKTVIFFLTLNSGTIFLMESAGIEDLIVNSTALGFLLNLDEMILAALRTDSLKHLMHSCDKYEFVSTEGEAQKQIELAHDRRASGDQANLPAGITVESRFQRVMHILPTHLILIFFMTYVAINSYYYKHCDYVDGRWISRPMHLARTLKFYTWNSLFPFLFPVPQEQESYWTMP